MARVLVTGASGLLGCSLVPVLAGRGHEVHSLSQRGAGELRADLSDREQAAAALERVQPDVIVNLAALTNVDACEADPDAAYRANALAVQNLVQWMRERRPGAHLVQVSTDQVYDGPGPNGEDAVRIRNTYALSKLAGELAAAPVPSTVLRTNFFGRSHCAGRASFTDWLHNAATRGTEITVFEDVYFSPLSLATLTDLVERVVARRPRGLFNVGSHGGMTKAEFAFAFVRSLGLETSGMRRGASDTSPALRARRPRDMRMDSARFEAAMALRLPQLSDEIQRIRSEYRESP